MTDVIGLSLIIIIIYLLYVLICNGTKCKHKLDLYIKNIIIIYKKYTYKSQLINAH